MSGHPHRQIQNREDIILLVDSFYEKAKLDPLLGPIFTDVAKVNWEVHLPKLYDFWEMLLLGGEDYRGRPFPPHLPLSLKAEHFRRWLELFYATVDQHFTGAKANEVKVRSLAMARNFMINLGLV